MPRQQHHDHDSSHQGRSSACNLCTIIAIDIAEFTSPERSILHQIEMLDGLYLTLEQALAEAGVDWDSCHHEDRGDGVFVLVPADHSSWSTLIEHFPSRLLAGLIRFNEVHSEPARLRLRVALHAGEVHHAKNSKIGPAVVTCFRLLDAELPRLKLRESRGVLALIVSDLVFHDAMAGDPVISPEFRRISVDVKNTRTDAWLRLFGAGQANDPRTLLTLLHRMINELLALLAVLKRRIITVKPNY